MQIYEQHWLSFTYVNSKQANRAVLGNASVCLQEEKKKEEKKTKKKKEGCAAREREEIEERDKQTDGNENRKRRWKGSFKK